MTEALEKLLALLQANDGINDKARLAQIVFEAFGLTQDRSVFLLRRFRHSVQFCEEPHLRKHRLVVV